MSFNSLRAGANRVLQNRVGGGKRGGGGSWLRWSPPQMPPNGQKVAEPVLYLPGNYVDEYDDTHPTNPFRRFRKHNFRKGDSKKDFRSIICSAGTNPHAPQPCVGCHEVDHGAKKAEPKDTVAFNIIHLVNYHHVPYIKDGQVQYKKDKPGEPVMIFEPCERTPVSYNCKWCGAEQQRPGSAPLVFGRQRIHEMGLGHLGNILSVERQLGNVCANCGTGIMRKYECQQCQTPLLDLGQLNIPEDKQEEFIQKFLSEQQQCPNPACRFVGLPQIFEDCGYVGWQKVPGRGCPENVETKPMSLFDTVVYLQREGEAAQSKIVCTDMQPLSLFRPLDGRSMPEVLKEVAEKLVDLVAAYQPDSLDVQAKILGVQNPWANAPQQQYGGPPPQQQAPYYGPPPQQAPYYGPPPQQQPAAPQQGYPQPQYQQPQQPPYQQYPQQPVTPYPQPQQGQPPVTYPNVPASTRPPYGGNSR